MKLETVSTMTKDKSRGFLQHERALPARRAVEERLNDSYEIYYPFPENMLLQQASRCMDCGVPFCHAGCPLGNKIPEWNDLVYKERWQEAYLKLSSTNNFPEFTGRICPAPCEAACVLGINDEPVTIEHIEKEIIERAFNSGWIEPVVPAVRTGKHVAVVGSGPAGLACAAQLNEAGHTVTVYERDNRPGGLLQYGIPDFKLDKSVVARRIEYMEACGITFKTGVRVGLDLPVDDLMKNDAVVLCVGATQARDVGIPGRDLDGIHFAWDYLWQQNKRVAAESFDMEPIHAEGKNVIVIGGGDTGSDCVGTANRQGASSVIQFELLPTPPEERPAHQPWPYYPMVLRTSSSHEEGVDRKWSVLTTNFKGENGKLTHLTTVNVEIEKDATGKMVMNEVEGSKKQWPVDLVILAVGYTGPERNGLLENLNVELTDRGNIATRDGYATSVPGVFAAGDGRRGQSLVVWAISEGREAAAAVDVHLMGKTALPQKGSGDLPFIR